MVHAIRLKAHGEPDVLAWEQVEVGKPASGQVRIRQTAVGVNFMEVSQRRGRSPIPLTLPGGGLGGEAAGVIEEVGEGLPIWPSETVSPMPAAVPAPTHRRASCRPRSWSGFPMT